MIVLFRLLLLMSMLGLEVSAAPQFSQSQCQQLNDERIALRRQLRQPYTAEQGKQLQARYAELSRLLQLHCKQPVKDEPVLRSLR